MSNIKNLILAVDYDSKMNSVSIHRMLKNSSIPKCCALLYKGKDIKKAQEILNNYYNDLIKQIKKAQQSQIKKLDNII